MGPNPLPPKSIQQMTHVHQPLALWETGVRTKGLTWRHRVEKTCQGLNGAGLGAPGGRERLLSPA